jgi:hypothetical protein
MPTARDVLNKMANADCGIAFPFGVFTMITPQIGLRSLNAFGARGDGMSKIFARLQKR